MSRSCPPEAPLPDGAFSVRIVRGSIYLDRELCDRHLGHTTSVAVIARDGQVLLLPLRGPAAGGMLLKIRNARGDRVVHADEFLRSVGIEPDAPGQQVAVRWLPEMAALLLEGIGDIPVQ